MSEVIAIRKARKLRIAAAAIVLALLAYLLLPFILAPILARCYPPKAAVWIITRGYSPLLRMSSDNFYRRVWLSYFNDLLDKGYASCPDIDSRVDAP